MNIYKYSSIEDAKENGQWILIPKYEYNSKSDTTSAYDFKTKKCSNSTVLTKDDDNIICNKFKTCDTLDTAKKCKDNQFCKWTSSNSTCGLDTTKFDSFLKIISVVIKNCEIFCPMMYLFGPVYASALVMYWSSKRGTIIKR